MRDLCSQGSKHKVVCAQNFISDPRLPYKQNKFCEKQKELTDEVKAKVILYPFPRCFQTRERSDGRQQVLAGNSLEAPGRPRYKYLKISLNFFLSGNFHQNF